MRVAPASAPTCVEKGRGGSPARAGLWAGVPKLLPWWMGRWPSWEPRGEPGPQAMFPETGTGASRAPGQHPEGAAGSCVTGLSPLRPRLPHSPRLCPNATIFLSKTECPGWSRGSRSSTNCRGVATSGPERVHGQKDARTEGQSQPPRPAGSLGRCESRPPGQVGVLSPRVSSGAPRSIHKV